MPSEPPTVFISYSHDSPEHMERVLALADRLRGDGIDADIDQYVDNPFKGWPLWMEDAIEAADFVLVVATETYEKRRRGREVRGRGHGARWEGAVISWALYDDALHNDRFVPVVFAAADAAHIPVFLKSVNSYDVSDDDGYESLLRRLTGRRKVAKRPLGPRLELPPRKLTPPLPVYSAAEAIRPMASDPPTVFISYSHADESWKDRLVKQLRVLALEDVLDVWDDRRIAVGDDWRPAIEDAMEKARVAVFLVSADFLISKFIRENEVPRILERRGSGLWVVPAIVHSCPWEEVPWLAKIQGRPKDGKPLSLMTRPKADSALSAIALEIAGLLRGDEPEPRPRDETPSTVPLAEGQPEIKVKESADSHRREFPDLSPQERLALIRKLNALTSHHFAQLIFALRPPVGLVPPSSAAQGQRVVAVLEWAESLEGCGLDALARTLSDIEGPR